MSRNNGHKNGACLDMVNDVAKLQCNGLVRWFDAQQFFFQAATLGKLLTQAA